ncbi:hypothetical protein CMI37_29280 [Candidatus Pacearchaeota archaeon]|nr:hypothetical protein [Candidatus Pacearchaeota archaeon]|tara:strand:- start:1348 stop:2031 length:684 start_codon:yes stop_codon:yes gene_type:complete
MGRRIGRILAKAIVDKDNIKPQLGDKPKISTYLRTRQEQVQVYEITMDIDTRSIAGDTLIWGNVDFGNWNEYKWGNSATTSFVLGHSVAGILGTTGLGSSASSYVLARRVNPSNTYIERFNNTTFKDAATTADWAGTAGECDFTNAEVAVSEIFALNSETYTQATLIATGTDVGNLAFELRFDGSNWESITNNTTLIAANPSNVGIEWRATCTGTATLTEVKIIYST